MDAPDKPNRYPDETQQEKTSEKHNERTPKVNIKQPKDGQMNPVASPMKPSKRGPLRNAARQTSKDTT